ncbi:hypothetical protein [Caulobacter sp. 1776]|uniref:hypothetical protein n=1 Tax=Caulobacter sp. 1776 TaxID=3156420 RepID=UPI0033992FB6
MLKILKATVAVCLAATLSGCISALPPTAAMVGGGGTYRYVPVRSDIAPQFYYAKSEAVAAAGSTEAARRAAMAARPSFGPFSLPTELQLMDGVAYDFFPRCGDAISWTNLVRAVAMPGASVKLDCH